MSKRKPQFMPDPVIWTDEQCCAFLNVSPGGTKLRELEAKHGFPKKNPVLGGRHAEEVREWIDFMCGRKRPEDIREEFTL